MSPKKEEDPRIVFPHDLGEELLRVAHEREHPESKLSPLLRALAREWINQGSFRGREEELQEITDRLDAVEHQLRALTEALGDAPSPSAAEQVLKVSSAYLDNLTNRVLEYLTTIADDGGVTPQITAKEIARQLRGSEDKPTEKQVLGRIKKLLDMQRVTIEIESGGRGGRRYRIEPNPDTKC